MSQTHAERDEPTVTPPGLNAASENVRTEYDATTPEPWAPDGKLRRLTPAALTLDRIGSWILTAIVLLLAIVTLALSARGHWLASLPPAIRTILVLLVPAFFAWLSIYWPRWEHQRTTYRVDRAGIEIRKGVIWHSTTLVPRSRVQHTDVSQGPLQRWFGLATLVIHTAGTQSASVPLSGLMHDVALRIRDYLIEGGRDAAQAVDAEIVAPDQEEGRMHDA